MRECKYKSHKTTGFSADNAESQASDGTEPRFSDPSKSFLSLKIGLAKQNNPFANSALNAVS